MRISGLALAASLAAAWTILPLAAFAHDGDEAEEENVEIHKRVRHGDGEHEDGPRAGRREGAEGPRGPHEPDPEMKEKFEKMRELEHKLREVSKGLRQGSDAEKAAAKGEARKILSEVFDAKLALDEAMLSKMEKHAAELKAKIARKKAGREKAIDSRLARMSGEGDDWD